jgi:hypothetical protein
LKELERGAAPKRRGTRRRSSKNSKKNADPQVGIRLIVRVLQAVLAEAPEPYASYADLKEDLKVRLARLRIPYDGGRIAEALDRLELGGDAPVVQVRMPAPRPPEPLGLTKAEAGEVFAQLPIPPLPTMPAVREVPPASSNLTQFRDDQRRAFTQVMDLILETSEHVTQLEMDIDRKEPT